MDTLIKKVVVTEKGAQLEGAKKYVVIVDTNANKVALKQEFTKRYGVKVAKVNLFTSPAKTKQKGKGIFVNKRPVLKKAIITLKKGEKAVDLIKLKKSVKK
ncbi:50S ribosomal protein L23 [Candidatus Peregrinibacteria bacterium CG08_land_8_20_14_0_20_41_10]|nr:MAG: 50S ribosomal protein L23 [Candidatus Peregrinibacteria bacterium CG08_land_8_20_14_0_20_41_10]